MSSKPHCLICVDHVKYKGLVKRAIELFEMFVKPPVIVKIWLIEAHTILTPQKRQT